MDIKKLQPRLENHFRESAAVKVKMVEECLEPIMAAVKLLVDTFKGGRKILLCGNGGSAADCQHMAAEFLSRLTKDFERPGLPAIALTTDTSFLTAYTNDYDFKSVFARQVETLGKPGDVLIAISTSGASPNIISAVEKASQGGLSTISLSGRGGTLNKIANVSISVPATSTQYIQEAHLSVEHIICELVEHCLFAENY